MRISKRLSLCILLILLVTITVACSNDVGKTDEEVTNDTVRNEVEDVDEEANDDRLEGYKDKDNTAQSEMMELFNEIATQSTETDILDVTEELTVGETGDITPGIYDMEIIKGRGNIYGERDTYNTFYINYSGQMKSDKPVYQSKVRLLLFEGDTLNMEKIDKVKFHPVPEQVEPLNEFGVGEYIVGRDILPGEYKLTTNAELDPDNSITHWELYVYGHINNERKVEYLEPESEEIVVTLKEGEVISLYYNVGLDVILRKTDLNLPIDDIKLIFEEM